MNIRTLAALCAAFLTIGIWAPASANPAITTINIIADVTAIDTIHNTIGLSPLPDPKTSVAEDAFTADASAVRQLLTKVAKGDRVNITVVMQKPPRLTSIRIDAHVTSWGMRFAVFLGSFLFIVALAMIVTRAHPKSFLVGADGRYSNSKTQLALWFATVMAAYLATVVLRARICGSSYLGGVDIPSHLLVLSGFSALSYGGAKAITTQKVNTIVAAGGTSPKTTATRANILTDLFQNDLGEADLGDFQMILVTLIAIVIFALSVINFLAYIELKSSISLPDVDTTLLSAFGIGQGAYLVKKLASNPGEG